MPVYRVTDPETGKTVKLEGDSPPTEQELVDIFAQINQPQKEELSLRQKVGDFFTGSRRETDVTEKLPELSDSGILAGEEVSKPFLAALLTTPDPNEIAKMISEQYPHIVTTYNKDAQGNVFPILTNRRSGVATNINDPGVSGMDVLQTLGIGAAFFPASKAVMGTSLLGKSTSVGIQSLGTQGAIEIGQTFAGGDFNTADIALAGLGGVFFEGIGNVLGSAMPAIKQQVRNGVITDKVRNLFKKEAKQLGVPEEAVDDNVIRMWAQKTDDRTGLEREFDVTLSNAQRSGNQAALREEDMLRSGVGGDEAQQIFLNEEKRQAQSLTDAAVNLQDDFGRGSPLVTSSQQAGAALREGIQAAERVADDAITQAYGQVEEAFLSPDGFRDLLKATRQATDSIEFTKVNVPAWEGLQKEIINSERMLTRLANKDGTTLKPVHIKTIESIRQGINETIKAAGNPADARNLVTMKNAFNNYLDEAVIKGLFTGDEKSLAALKNARGVFRDYMAKFGVNVKSTRLGTSKDPAGDFIKKIILEDPTNEQMVRSLFSASGLSKPGAAKLAQRYKNLLGSDSLEWNMVRQAAFDHVVSKKMIDGMQFVDGAKTFRNIVDAEKVNKSLIDEIFTNDEWAKIKRFAALSKKTAPELVKSRGNPSGSAITILKNGMDKLLEVMPFLDLGFSSAGGAFIKTSRAAEQARGAFRPFRERGLIRRFSQGSATGTSPDTLEGPANRATRAASGL